MTVKKESMRFCLHLSFAFCSFSMYPSTRSGLKPLSFTKNSFSPSRLTSEKEIFTSSPLTTSGFLNSSLARWYGQSSGTENFSGRCFRTSSMVRYF